MAARVHVIEKVVAATGTAEQVTTAHIVARTLLIIPGKAAAANTGSIYIGDSDVDKTAHYHLVLATSASPFEFPVPAKGLDLSTLYIDAATSADGARFLYTS